MTSRRPPPAADKTAQNQSVIKSLLKLPGNKHCADCKRNAHPRWASWNLGIFICIRCSGIHRGMGTHISRVKSVDLDSWTDEQLQSMLRWGNSRANKYWEAKLAEGHVPSESKIENFIRTKYDSKRWVMEGGIPDPATLGDSDDDDTPLRVVQEKAKAEAARSTSTASIPPQRAAVAQPQVNLFDDPPSNFSSSVTNPPPINAPVNKAPPAPPKQTKPADSLLGLDFFSPTSSSPRTSTDGSSVNAGGSSRPDLNRSILSLYSSAPKQQPQQHKTHQSTNSGSFGAFGGPSVAQTSSSSGLGGLGGLVDDLGGLSFSSSSSAPSVPVQPPSKPSPFASLTAGLVKPSGNTMSSNRFTSPTTSSAPKPSQSTQSSGFNDIFSMSAAPIQNTIPSSYAPKPAAAPSASLFDDNAWGSPAPASQSNNNATFDWNTPSVPNKPMVASKPVVTSDDDFGAFSTGGGFGAPKQQQQSTSSGSKPITFDEDLFKNEWNS